MLDKMSNYDLGILWGNGCLFTHRTTPYMYFSHQERYFLERMQKYGTYNIITLARAAKKEIKDYYVLTFFSEEWRKLESMGWSPARSHEKRLPELNDYKDFIRAYVELHSLLDYSKRTSGSGRKSIKIQLRIFGHYHLLTDINNILTTTLGLTTKKVYTPNKGSKTAVLSFRSPPEIEQIYNYLTGTPCFEPYWEHVDYMLRHPTKPVE